MKRVHFQVRVGIFNCQQILAKISFVIFDIMVKIQIEFGLTWDYWWLGFTDLGLINWHVFKQSDCRNCCLYIIIQKITPQAKSGKYFQIWLFPRFGGKKWRRSEHAHASYPGLDTAAKWLRMLGYFCVWARGARVQCANGRPRERTKHLFLRILSHQWTEIGFIIYKDLGTSTETLQVTCQKLQTVSDLTSSEISGVKLVFLRPSMSMAGKLNFS